jgi:alginate O-acetyltransferase complex protein AlgI
VLLLSLAVKSAFRNYILLIASIIFYITGEKGYVIIMILSVLMNHLFAKIIGLNRSKDNKTRIVFIVAVASNLLLLCIFKYLNFIVRNINTAISSFDVVINMPYIHLPVGISFFTFQAMSYVIDVYRGEVQVQKKFSNTMLYISLFPQLIAGPIVRYIDIEKQLAGRIMPPALVEEGILRFVTGLGKKVLIANNMALVADGVFNSEIGNLSTPYAWLGIIAYTLQIYFDFSGYSDMAIGLGKIFGFHFLENFNYPYIAKSIKEFWRRWHISLSTWFRDYLYIPLGGNRKGVYRTYINLIIVFFLTGLWHGAEWTFIYGDYIMALFLYWKESDSISILKDLKLVIFTHFVL